MDEVFRQAPAIIEQAAKSPLGLFALMIMSLSILGFVFFRSSSERTRMAIFVLMFLGVAAFGAAAIRITSTTAVGNPDPNKIGALTQPPPSQHDINGLWVARVSENKDDWFYFKFEVHDGEVLGTVQLPFPLGDGGIVNGRLSGDKLSFDTRHEPQFSKNVVTTQYRGEVADEAIGFLMQVGGNMRKFTAVRPDK